MFRLTSQAHRAKLMGPASILRRHASSSSRSFQRDLYIFLALATATGGAYYYQSAGEGEGGLLDDDGHFKSFGSGSNVTFKSGGQTYTFPRKSEAEIEKMLHANEDGQRIGRPGNPVVRWDRNWLGSNEPPEDRSAVDLVPRIRGSSEVRPWWKIWESDTPTRPRIEGDRDLTFFSIFDGHAGSATSELLSKTLNPTLALALAGLQVGQTGWMDRGLKGLWTGAKGWTPTGVTEALQKAFLTLDYNLCFAPLALLPGMSRQAVNSEGSANGTPAQTFVALSQPGMHGACAVSTIVDAEHDDLYVAITGDCRAVAGWQSKDGTWRCDVLTEDQMGENPREVARMRSEHPASESETVIRRGRIQGGLQPTRAFGDANYKWTAAQHAAVSEIYKQEGVKSRRQAPNHYTPPYVTARPEVSHRKLSNSDEKLRFVIMATDGLWDRITSEEATLLVASHIAHRTHPDIPADQLPKIFSLADPPAERLYPAQDLPGTPSRWAKSWVYAGDKNAATHLIRNSMGGGDKQLRSELLSVNGDIARSLRDDVTVTVIFFDDGLDARSLSS